MTIPSQGVPEPQMREMRKVVSTPQRNRARIASGAITPLKSTDSEKSILKLVCVDAHLHTPTEEPMTKQQAFKAAQNMYGKKAAVRDNNRGPSFQAARDEARARIAAQGPRGKGEAAKTWDDATREDRATVRYYRYAVGYIMPMLGCFLIRGEGDTWAEAIESAKRQEVVA